MKKKLSVGLLFLLVVLFSCQKKEVTTPASASDTLSASRVTIRTDTTVGTTDTFTIHSTIQWTAAVTPSAGWLQLDKTSGTSGNTIVKMTVLSNNGATPRTAIITLSPAITGSATPVTITITQTPYVIGLAWQKPLGGSSDELANAIVRTSDGGYVMAGYTMSDSADGDIVNKRRGLEDLWVVKLNASGVKQWSKTYGGQSSDIANAIITTSDGGFIIAGNTSSTDGDITTTNHGYDDFWVLKLDANGNKIWAKTFGGSGTDDARAIAATPDGGYVVTGFSSSNDGDVTGHHGTTSYSDVWVLKLDATGTKQWAKSFGGSQEEEGFSVISTADGGYAIAGMAASNDGDVTGIHSVNRFDMWVLKLDAGGSKQWASTFGGTLDDEAWGITPASDGGYVVAGFAQSKDGDATANRGVTNMWVLKLDANGQKQKSKMFGGTNGIDGACAITAAPDGGYMVAGYGGSTDGDLAGNGGSLAMWGIKLNANLDKQWSKFMGGTGTDQAYALTTSGDGGFVLAGFTASANGDVTGFHPPAGNYDMWVVKLSVQ